MGDARRRRREIGTQAPPSEVLEPAEVIDIAAARPVLPAVRNVVQAKVVEFLTAMADEGFHVERITLDVRAFGRLMVELAANAASQMPAEVPDAVHLKGPTGGLVVVDFVPLPSKLVR